MDGQWFAKTGLTLLLSAFLILASGHDTRRAQSHPPKGLRNYALLIGGGLTEQDSFESFYRNIQYAARALKKMGYSDDGIKVLFYGGQSPAYPLVQGAATKRRVLEELSRLEKTLDAGDSLLIFRSGHGMIKLIFEKYGILPNGRHLPENEPVNVLGTAAVMRFPDGCLSCHELQTSLARIRAKQIVVILNQCFSGQFTDITATLGNTVVITETKANEIAFVRKTTTKSLKNTVWPFVKCLFDGFLGKHSGRPKNSVIEAFEYMKKCNPNVAGLPLNPVQDETPLLKAVPQIRYGRGLRKGAVYIY